MSKAPARVKVESIRPRAVSIPDGARYLGVAPKTIHNMLSIARRNGDPLPFRVHFFGAKPLLDLADLDTYLDSLEQEPSERPAKRGRKPISGISVGDESRDTGERG